MKFLITTVGTAGDIELALSLGIRLKAHKHEVTVASHSIHERKFGENSINFVCILPKISVEDLNRAIMCTQKQFFFKDYLINDFFLKEEGATVQNYLELVRGVDIVVCHYVDFAAQYACFLAKKPYAVFFSFQGLIRTKYAPPAHLPNLGKLGNRMWWQLLDIVKYKAQNKMRTKLMRSVNGGVAPTHLSISGSLSVFLNMVAVSKYIDNRRADFPENVHITGQWYNASAGLNYIASPLLQEFIVSKNPQVVFALGSMNGAESERNIRIMEDTLKKIGNISAIILRGYGENFDTHIKNNIYYSSEAIPYSFLFKHIQVVVHHGGAGTSQDACRMGRVSVVVPHFADQPYFAKRLYELGVAAKPIPIHKFGVESLKKALIYVLNNAEIAENAKKLSAKMQLEDGVGEAVALLEKYGKGLQS